MGSTDTFAGDVRAFVREAVAADPSQGTARHASSRFTTSLELIRSPADVPPPRNVLKKISASQIEKFYGKPTSSCERRGFLEFVCGVEAPQNKWAAAGDAIHTQLDGYVNSGKAPEDPRAALVMPHLPAPRTPGVLAEAWINFPSNVRNHLGEVIQFTGKRDLVDGRLPHWVVTDTKTAGSRWKQQRKAGHELRLDTQMVLYAEACNHPLQVQTVPGGWGVPPELYAGLARRTREDPVTVRHMLVRMKGKAAAPLFAEWTFSPADLLEQFERVEEKVRRIVKAYQLKDFRDAEPNWDACSSYGGCPFEPICLDVKADREGPAAAAAQRLFTIMSAPPMTTVPAGQIGAGLSLPISAAPSPQTAIFKGINPPDASVIQPGSAPAQQLGLMAGLPGAPSLSQPPAQQPQGGPPVQQPAQGNPGLPGTAAVMGGANSILDRLNALRPGAAVTPTVPAVTTGAPADPAVAAGMPPITEKPKKTRAKKEDGPPKEREWVALPTGHHVEAEVWWDGTAWSGKPLNVPVPLSTSGHKTRALAVEAVLACLTPLLPLVPTWAAATPAAFQKPPDPAPVPVSLVPSAPQAVPPPQTTPPAAPPTVTAVAAQPGPGGTVSVDAGPPVMSKDAATMVASNGGPFTGAQVPKAVNTTAEWMVWQELIKCGFAPSPGPLLYTGPVTVDGVLVKPAMGSTVSVDAQAQAAPPPTVTAPQVTPLVAPPTVTPNTSTLTVPPTLEQQLRASLVSEPPAPTPLRDVTSSRQDMTFTVTVKGPRALELSRKLSALLVLLGSSAE